MCFWEIKKDVGFLIWDTVDSIVVACGSSTSEYHCTVPMMHTSEERSLWALMEFGASYVRLKRDATDALKWIRLQWAMRVRLWGMLSFFLRGHITMENNYGNFNEARKTI